jgi:hypothetical protein
MHPLPFQRMRHQACKVQYSIIFLRQVQCSNWLGSVRNVPFTDRIHRQITIRRVVAREYCCAAAGLRLESGASPPLFPVRQRATRGRGCRTRCPCSGQSCTQAAQARSMHPAPLHRAKAEKNLGRTGRKTFPCELRWITDAWASNGLAV